MIQEYIYEYTNGERSRNLGFTKIDKQLDKCVLQIYARDIDEVKGIVFQGADEKYYIGSWEPVTIESAQPDIPVAQSIPVVPEELEEPMEAVAPQVPELEVEEYIQPRSITFEKIQRKELSRLPRKDWRIANNSFLLHGFYNYHHLLYIEDDGEVWVGVPGIFHEKEKLAANTFGFTHFRRLADVPVELEENERNSYEDFGYWCRQIQIPKV